ncbi:hypothetical protein [Pseudaestuariivita sp.]|uniref:hypothetical protein n=1 Tax=Pseudaestuariivita sp. TaxID=2211669 RepID=UPI0040583976
MSGQVSRTADKLAEASAEITDQARTAAEQTVSAEAQRLQDGVTERTERAQSAAEAAQAEVPSGSLEAQALGQVVAGLEKAGAFVRGQDAQDLVHDVQQFARRNPLLFLGGAVAAGFVAARFLKSSNGAAHTHAGGADPWTGHLQTSGPAAYDREAG